MNPNSQHKLLWIISAMTLPVSFIDESYYYDGELNEFFYSIRSIDRPASFSIMNINDLPFANQIESDLAVRLELINDESSQIIEIPRLSIADKVNIQLKFLSQLPGISQLSDLILAAESQEDDHKFVFDDVLALNEISAPLVSYWDEFKFHTVITYLQRVAKTIGKPLDSV